MGENLNNIWNKDKWTLQAREIIKVIPKFPEASKLILIIRHSHRRNSRDINDTISMNLTSLGKGIAIKFGQLIPKNRKIRLHYSLSPRCKETAELIYFGHKSIGGTGKIEGPLKDLYDVGGTGEFITNEAFKYSGNGFVLRWIADLYSPNKIIPFLRYCQHAAKVIWSKSYNLPEKGMDIHITHDLFLMALRMGWFAIPPLKEWPSFLGGMIFTISEKELILFNNSKLEAIQLPYWWFKL